MNIFGFSQSNDSVDNCLPFFGLIRYIVHQVIKPGILQQHDRLSVGDFTCFNHPEAHRQA